MALDKETLFARHGHRKVPLDGAYNVRDLGGLPTVDGRITRRGLLYRADTLAFLSDADLQVLADLRLRAVVDFRSPQECARAPDRLPPIAGLTWWNPGFLPRGSLELFAHVNAGTYDADASFRAMLGQYRHLALEHLVDYRKLVTAILEMNHIPLLFHCASGKDRAGIATAIILLALGVPSQCIIEDYVISNYQRRPVDVFAAHAPSYAVEPVMAADPRYMEAAIGAMQDSYGSIDGYLAEGLGLDATALAGLRAIFTA